MNIVEKARETAELAHGDQVYGTGDPYVYHLDQVANTAKRMEYPDEVIAACYLHDTIEDTNLSSIELRNSFPGYIVDAVEAVTYIKESGNDKIEQAKSNKIGHVIKFCDASCNFSNTIINGPKFGTPAEVSIKRYAGYISKLLSDLPSPDEIRLYIQSEITKT